MISLLMLFPAVLVLVACLVSTFKKDVGIPARTKSKFDGAVFKD